MKESMAGKVALVTGASSGIGRASALRFAQEGAKVVVVANKSVQGGKQTVAMIEETGGEAIFIQGDISKSSIVASIVEKTLEKFSRLDYAFNNAGVDGVHTLTADYPEDDFDRVIEVNQKGVYLCMKYEIPAMLKNGGGVIVNTSSVAGLKGATTNIAYVASKYAVVGMSKVAALEYAQKGIRVIALCPGYVYTPMLEHNVIKGSKEMEADVNSRVPLGRMGQPEEIAEAVVWLCSDAASFVTGLAMPVDGAGSA